MCVDDCSSYVGFGVVMTPNLGTNVFHLRFATATSHHERFKGLTQHEMESPNLWF